MLTKDTSPVHKSENTGTGNGGKSGDVKEKKKRIIPRELCWPSLRGYLLCYIIIIISRYYILKFFKVSNQDIIQNSLLIGVSYSRPLI